MTGNTATSSRIIGRTPGFLLAGFLMLFVLCAPPAQAVGASVKPREMMALLVTKFPKYATWPKRRSSSEPMVLCLVTQDRKLRSTIVGLLDGKTHTGRKWKVMTHSNLDDAKDCALVFIGKDLPEPDTAWYERMSDAGVLTFGEKEPRKDRTSIINFILVGKKMRFDLNLASAEKAGIKINSRLADVANKVIKR